MPLLASAQAAVQLAARAAVSLAAAPFLAWARWLSLWLGVLLQALAYVGVQPTGYSPQSRVKELNQIIDYHQRREDSYRQAMREMQEAMEAQEGDKKKALRALKKARLELDLLSEELAQLQGAQGGVSPAGPTSAARAGSSGGERAQVSTAGLHWSVGLLAAAVYWFYMQDVPALQRKLVFTLLFPLAWFYTTAVVLQRHAWCALQLYVCAWFLVGFIVAHRFAC